VVRKPLPDDVQAIIEVDGLASDQARRVSRQCRGRSIDISQLEDKVSGGKPRL